MTVHFRPRTTELARLLPNAELGRAAAIPVQNLSLDSRNIKAGDVFIALVGTHQDGRNFIAKAVELGASAVLVEADKEWQGVDWLGNVPVIAIENLSAHVSAIAGRFFGDPSTKIPVIGVTGTNGKTTCTLLAAQLLAAIQQKAGVIGTVGYGLLDSTSIAPTAQQVGLLTSTGLTTPDPIAVQHILAELQEAGAAAVALEVSSHSLEQQRVAGVQFSHAIFTNLTQDHLDYHGDLVSYGNAKAKLLQAKGLKTAIINVDDDWAKTLPQKAPAGLNILRYSTRGVADIYAQGVELHAGGVRAQVVSPWGTALIQSPLLGEFNLGNLLAVVACVCDQGYSLEQIAPCIEKLEPAPGRMQLVTVDSVEQEVQVIVDYAHTPDALENTLNAIHQHKPGRVWTVFGCGGDRDKTKRPLMGKIAERLSDYVIVTNDNPRSEDPSAIAADIVRGMLRPSGSLVIADRAQAIDFAVQQARAGDIILIAGKGHEDYQIFAAQTLPFSDSKHARLSLQRRIAKRDTAERSDQSKGQQND